MTLTQIQKRVRDILLADEEIQRHGIAVVAVDSGDAEAEIEKALGDVGLCAVVRTCEWRQKSEAAKNAVGDGSVVVAVGDMTALNRAAGETITGQDVAEYIAWRLQLEPIEPGRSVLTLDGSISTMFEEMSATAVTTVTFKFQHQLSNKLGDANEE